MLDLILRGCAIGTILTTALVLAAGTRGRGPAALAVFGLLTGCYLVVSAPAATQLPQPLRQALIVAATLVPLALTWLMMELLTDASQRRWPWYLLALVGVAAALAVPIWGPAGLLRGLLVLVLYLGLVGLAVLSDRDDLVAARRRLRRGFLALMGTLGVIVTAVETSIRQSDLPDWVPVLQAAAFWAVALAFAGWALRAGGDVFAPAPASGPRAPTATRSGLAARLEAAMQAETWRREGLTIGQLAETLDVPEHRLRTTINRDLGHRNYSTFVNGYRIEAAMRALSDPDREATTILEIAYETGFASLGPFNRAFRARTGQSPREFRAAHLPAAPARPGDATDT